VDLSLVTGEPIPAEKAAGDTVVSGALNRAGTLLVQASAPASESFLAQVVRHVEDARALKPGVLHLVDKVLRVYTPAVLTIAALALTGWLVGSWAVTGAADVQRAVFAGLSVLVMGYPCAVGIAAPLAIVRGAGEAADLGIIMRTGEAFQTFRQVTRVLLDKTGTLTVGRPAVAGLQPVPGTGADELLAVAAAAEDPLEHPLARAITGAAAQRRLELPPLDAEGFQATAGFGVTAQVAGQRVLAGRPAFLTEAGIDLTGLEQSITGLEGEGHTVIAVARGTRPLGVIALADTLRPEAAEAVAALRQAGLTPVLVTGDNPRAAAHIARAAGIDQVHAQVLPDGKAALVGELQAAGARVAMVGDGINGSPHRAAGLRRGEACGLRWCDLDLDRQVAHINWQVQHPGGALVACPLKTEASRRVLALDATTVEILRLHWQAQQEHFRAHGITPSGYVFTDADGGPLSPDYLTRTFGKLIRETGLPPVRRHDLRHGAASLALAAGADLKVIADQLGHCSIVLTADTYISVAAELALAKAEAVAWLILHAGKRPPGGTRVRSSARPQAIIAA